MAIESSCRRFSPGGRELKFDTRRGLEYRAKLQFHYVFSTFSPSVSAHTRQHPVLIMFIMNMFQPVSKNIPLPAEEMERPSILPDSSYRHLPSPLSSSWVKIFFLFLESTQLWKSITLQLENWKDCGSQLYTIPAPSEGAAMINRQSFLNGKFKLFEKIKKLELTLFLRRLCEIQFRFQTTRQC